MRKNTAGFILAFIFTVVAVVLFRIVFNAKDAVVLCLLVICSYIAGSCACLSETSHGKVYAFKELKDAVYTYLGEVNGVYVLRCVDKAGNEKEFAAAGLNWSIVPEKIKVGMSFRKVGEKVIIL